MLLKTENPYTLPTLLAKVLITFKVLLGPKEMLFFQLRETWKAILPPV